MGEERSRQSHIRARPLVFWSGFPSCALLLKRVAEEFGDAIVICGTQASVPFQGLEAELGHRIVWLDSPDDIWKRREEFSDRDLILHSGWNFPGWLNYDRLMRAKGAKVIVMADNRYRGDFRQWVGALWFRLFLKHRFDGALVPGISGRKLMRFFGMRDKEIFSPLYGAYEGIYAETVPIERRANEFLFVGQLIERKAVDVLLAAFATYRQSGGTWTLRLVGEGPLKESCRGDGVTVEPFAQPCEIAEKMNAAKVLVLPSMDDNWGTVVCEAAACGMQIIASKNAGASADIIQDGINGIVIDSVTADNLFGALEKFDRMSDEQIRNGSAASKKIARRFSSEAFHQAFINIQEAFR